jgi:hypothetical protein
MDPSQSSLDIKRESHLIRAEHLKFLLPESRNFNVIDEYSSAPSKVEATSIVINYPHIKERIVKFKN